MARQPNGRPAINKGADGRFHTWVTVGVKSNGDPRREHLSGATATAVSNKIDDLNKRRDLGGGVPLKIDLVGEWLTYWLEHVIRPNRAYKTHEAYRPIIHGLVIPEIGGWRLDGMRLRLEPEHVEQLYAKLGKTYSDSYVKQVHRVLRKALKDAHRRGRVSRNVCDLIDPPAVRAVYVRSLTLDEAQAVIVAAVADVMALRWMLGLLLGLRQGETLGLRWSRVDLEEGTIKILSQTQRHTWQHGCEDPHACAARFCRVRPCRDGCKIHRGKNGCPPICGKDCVGHARACPSKHGGGIVEVPTKSATRENEPLPLIPYLIDLFREWREHQIREYAEIGLPWDPEGLVFTTALGTAIDPRRDHECWEELLAAAGVKDYALHAARHTAGTLMAAAGVKIEIIQEVFRHADIRTTRGYVEVSNELKRQAVEKIAASLFDGSLLELLKGTTAPNLHR